MQSLSTILLAITLVPLPARGECNRHPPLGTDCSAYDTTCHVRREDNGTVYYDELEQAMENTRICYRTCIDDGPLYDICEATVTSVYHQKLKKEPSTPSYTLQRIFSPNFHSDRDYRKSTVCSYNVKCAKNQLLSYSFIAHSLEGRSGCSGSNECLDRLSIKLPNYGDYVFTTCANEVQTDEIFQDGLNELSIQFKTNRKKQYRGFYMFVWCIHQGFKLDQAPVIPRQTLGYVHSPACTSTPADVETDQRRRRGRRGAHFDNLGNGLLRRMRRMGEYTLYIVQTGEWVSFANHIITVTREGSGPEYTRTYSDVSSLLVSNRFTKHTFDNCEGRHYSGYGTLLFYVTRNGYFAHFRQEGVDPTTRPTSTEKKLIAQLQRGLVKAFEDEFYDVWDSQDADEAVTQSANDTADTQFGRQRSHADWHLPDVALTYGRACNGQLRAVACAYQEIVLRRNCITGHPLPQVSHVTFDYDTMQQEGS